MNKTEFTNLLKNPNSISPTQTNSIEEILDNYPYFQAARLIHLKGLKQQHSFKYNTALKEAAAHTTNRTVLFDFITDNTLDATNKLANEKQFIDDTELIDVEVFDKSTTFGSDEKVENKIPDDQSKKLQFVEEKLEVGKPLTFNQSEIHSFREWLQLSTATPIERSTTEKSVKKDPEKENKFDLIDEFINTKAKLQPTLTEDQPDISISSTIENESLMTETLARVYLEQKKYGKAIQAFKILSLKYPEKSSFFADRIKAIKFLQKNNT